MLNNFLKFINIIILFSQRENLRSNLAVARQREDEAKGILQFSQSRGKVFNALVKFKDSNHIKGFHVRFAKVVYIGL